MCLREISIYYDAVVHIRRQSVPCVRDLITRVPWKEKREASCLDHADLLRRAVTQVEIFLVQIQENHVPYDGNMELNDMA